MVIPCDVCSAFYAGTEWRRIGHSSCLWALLCASHRSMDAMSFRTNRFGRTFMCTRKTLLSYLSTNNIECSGQSEMNINKCHRSFLAFAELLHANFYSSIFFAGICYNFVHSFRTFCVCILQRLWVCVCVARGTEAKSGNTLTHTHSLADLYFVLFAACWSTCATEFTCRWLQNLLWIYFQKFLSYSYSKNMKKNIKKSILSTSQCHGNGHIFMPSIDDWCVPDSIESSCIFQPALTVAYQMPSNRFNHASGNSHEFDFTHISPDHLTSSHTTGIHLPQLFIRNCNHVMQSHHTKDWRAKCWMLNVQWTSNQHDIHLESIIQA